MDYYARLKSQADELMLRSNAVWKQAQEAEANRNCARADKLAGRSSTLREAAEVLYLAAEGVIEDLRDKKVTVIAYRLPPGKNARRHLDYQEGVKAALDTVSTTIAAKHAAIKAEIRRKDTSL